MVSEKINKIKEIVQNTSTQKYLKALWLIPVLILIYIIWMNFMPVKFAVSYFIDIGGEDTTGEARITGPFDRISDRMEMGEFNVRNLEKDMVYLELKSGMLRNASEISMKVRLKDKFPDSGIFILGARGNSESGYQWKESYVPFYSDLANLPMVATNESTQIYATGRDSSSDFKSVDDFLENPPFGSVLATNMNDLNLNQKVSREELGYIDKEKFAVMDEFNVQFISDVNDNNYLDSETSLRGSHDFYFFSSGGTLELKVTKRDLNWYEGEDSLEVLVYSLDGTHGVAIIIDDDGDNARSSRLGYAQHQTLKIENLEKGIYHLALKSLGEGDDFVITRLQLNQGKLVMPEEIFLAGNFYLDGEPGLTTIWCYLFSDGEIKFSTAHKASLQNVILSGESYNQTISIDAVNMEFSTGLLKAGMYQITSEAGDTIIKTSSGYFSFTKDSLFIPVSDSAGQEKDYFEIDTSLRGGHTFWTYVDNDTLELTVNKQDLNWYENTDELAIQVYDIHSELKSRTSIPDDGDVGNGREIGRLQSASLTIQDVRPGAYRIELKGNADLLIRKIEINQKKLVIDGKVWAVGMNPSYFRDGLDFDPVRLFGKNFRAGEVRLLTYHNSGLQQVEIAGDNINERVDVNETNTSFSVHLQPGVYSVTAPRQNIIIEFAGYLSFTPDSFFLPERCEVIDLKYDLSWAQEHADYIIVNHKDYVEPIVDYDRWIFAQASWKADELLIEDNVLSFCLRVPHLKKEPEKTIPIDFIEIKVKG